VRPNEALSRFSGGSLDGTWLLTVADLAAGDAGALLQWCLEPY
jgi:subtilisin-like proprotein convertase family protein